MMIYFDWAFDVDICGKNYINRLNNSGFILYICLLLTLKE